MLQLENIPSGENSSSPPPDDIRIDVEKVARFVASKRPGLEKFFALNAGMRKYRFMLAVDPYHAYYLQRLSEFRARNGITWPESLLFKDKNAAVIEQILKDFQRSGKASAVGDTVLVSPLSGELVTSSSMSRHMQDPKYKEQKERLFAKIRETTLAQDDLISTSILHIARRCPHGLGTTVEELCNAVELEIGSTNPELVSESKRGRFLDDEDDVEYVDDCSLVFEDDLLSQHPAGPVCISVWVPDIEKKVEISVDSLSVSVRSLKEKIARQMVVPHARRLKLQKSGQAGFFRDWASLANYNVAAGATLSLSW